MSAAAALRMLPVDTNAKAADLCGLDLHEVGNKQLVLGLCIVWDIYSTNTHGAWCQEKVKRMLGDRFGISICGSFGQWFIWSEQRQNHLGDVHTCPIKALAQAVEIAEASL